MDLKDIVPSTDTQQSCQSWFFLHLSMCRLYPNMCLTSLVWKIKLFYQNIWLKLIFTRLYMSNPSVFSPLMNIKDYIWFSEYYLCSIWSGMFECMVYSISTTRWQLCIILAQKHLLETVVYNKNTQLHRAIHTILWLILNLLSIVPKTLFVLDLY